MATLATHAVACSDSHVGPPIDRTSFDEQTCGTGGSLSGVKPAQPVDYLAIRRYPAFVSDAGPGDDPVVEESIGTPCSGATAQAACVSALDALPREEGFREGNLDFVTLDYQLVWTRGNETGVIGTRDALIAFLGTIDSAQDAALVARFAEGHNLICDTPNARTTHAGVEILTSTGFACGEGTAEREHVLLIAPDGTVTVRESVVIEVGDPNCVIGRLTHGLALAHREPGSDLGGFFANMAHLEAASVLAFERLAEELEALGAPCELIQRALVSADDEARHTRDVAALARRFGGTVLASPRGEALPRRTAFEIAIENACEGCVRETYGALVATHQAHVASDPEVRDTLDRIASDETNHAAFSWSLAAWLDTQLDEAERHLVREARGSALRSFGRTLDPTLPEADRALAGLPDGVASRALFDGLVRELFLAA